MHSKTENPQKAKPRLLRNKCRSLLAIIPNLNIILSQGQQVELTMCIEHRQQEDRLERSAGVASMGKWPEPFGWPNGQPVPSCGIDKKEGKILKVSQRYLKCF